MRLRGALRGALSIPLIAAGCLLPTPLEKPSQGPQWIELASKHFTLTTDLDGGEATLVVRAFERSYALLSRAVFGDAPAPEFETDIVDFRTKTELQQFIPDRFAGEYIAQLPSDLEPSPTMLMSGELSHANRIVFVHELAHRFDQVALGAMPRWLDEGLAEFYSTVQGDLEHPEVGVLDPDYGFALASTGSDTGHVIFRGELIVASQLPLPSQLMDFKGSGFYAAGRNHAHESKRVRDDLMKRNYVAAWALVHMLMTTDSPSAVRFRQALREGARLHNASLALDRMDLDDDALDREFLAYLAGTGTTPSRPAYEGLPPPLEGVRRRDLREAQILVWWARLSSLQSERGERYLRGAIAAAPGDPEVQFWSGRLHMLRGQRAEAESLFGSALAQDPDNPGYQLALLALHLGGERDKRWSSSPADTFISGAIERLTKVARTAPELITVASYHLLENRPEIARPLAERACRIGPNCWQCLHAYALAVFDTGDAPQAVSLERRAFDRLPDADAAPASADLTLKRALRYYRNAVANPGTPPAPPTTLFFPW